MSTKKLAGKTTIPSGVIWGSWTVGMSALSAGVIRNGHKRAITVMAMAAVERFHFHHVRRRILPRNDNKISFVPSSAAGNESDVAKEGA
jgi:hypothetical protein